MSQEYYTGKGKGRATSDDGSQESERRAGTGPQTPSYMTVGGGDTISQNAAQLQMLLNQQEIDRDSGYGESIAGDSAVPPGWSPMMLGNSRPSPSYSHSTLGGAGRGSSSEAAYNHHRANLANFINQVVKTLRELQAKNATWPLHYPFQEQRDIVEDGFVRPGLMHSQSTAAVSSEIDAPRPGMLRRWGTSAEDRITAEADSSPNAYRRVMHTVDEDGRTRLDILRLDLKLGSLHNADLIHSMERNSVAALLDGKISSSIRHLFSLRERIEDTGSKVLVTGDTNAGKSTFCNALLRRKILPESKTPCTQLFCEVLDARKNGGSEEVHAVHRDVEYNRHDESTYDIYSFSALEGIFENEEVYYNYSQCKLYVKDVRTVSESLLNNGVVDIFLIDAPGLNSSNTKTTALFARQEEIDVVVFVVDGPNGLTASAKDFIAAANAEKAQIFIVANKWDDLSERERNKMQKIVAKDLGELSPATLVEEKELVHYVSSNAVPMSPGGPDGGGGPSGDPEDKDGKQVRDFEALEQALRRFVLERRADSKLLPAKTYMLNLLEEVTHIAAHNKEVAESEVARVTKELQGLEPVLQRSKESNDKVSNELKETVEGTCEEVYQHTYSTLRTTVSEGASVELDVKYGGIFSCFEYADELREVMLSRISTSVKICEEHARSKAVDGVQAIQNLGLMHLGNEYEVVKFMSAAMFQRKKDALARMVHVETEWLDFFDWDTIMQQHEKLAGTSMALTVVGVVGTRAIGGFSWIDGALGAARILGSNNLRKLIVPGVLAASKLSSLYSYHFEVAC